MSTETPPSSPHDTSPEAEAPTVVAPEFNTPEITDTIEANQGLMDMKSRARQIFKCNDDDPSGRRQKTSFLENFGQRLSDFRDALAESRVVRYFPNLAQRQAIVDRMIEVAETPQGYIEDTQDLKALNDEAKQIAEFNGDDTPTGRNEKTRRLEELAEKLSEFEENSPIGQINKQAVIDTIVTTAETPPSSPDNDDPSEPDDPDEPPVLDERAEERRQQHLAMMERINAADRLHGYARVLALGDLAIQLNTLDMGFGDLGVIAAKRIQRSGTRGIVGQVLTRRTKNSDYYLHKMATSRGNMNAATAMARGGYLFDRTIDKGRNDALYEVSKQYNVRTAEGRDHIDHAISNMRGLRAVNYRYEAGTDVAEALAEPERLTAVVGMYDLFKKEKAKAKVAVAMARRGQIDRAQDVASSIKFRSKRRQALYDISKFIPTPTS